MSKVFDKLHGSESEYYDFCLQELKDKQMWGQADYIEALRAEVSQLTVALAAEREKYAIALNRIVNFEDMVAELNQQLAAAQLENQRLRDVAMRFTKERWHSAFAKDWADHAASAYSKEFDALLSTPTDTAALDAYVEPWKKDAERYRWLCEYGYEYRNAIAGSGSMTSGRGPYIFLEVPAHNSFSNLILDKPNADAIIDAAIAAQENKE